MRTRGPQDRASWVGEKVRLTEALRRGEPTLKMLGKHWNARKTGGGFNSDIVSARVLSFRSKLRLAGGLSYGKATAASVFPIQGDRHKMAVLYLTSESSQARDDIERLEEFACASEKSDSYGVTVTKELMTGGWGSIAVSPRSYEELNDQDRTTIRYLVADHSRVRELLRPPSQRPKTRSWRRR